jgi:hypothetical protein
LCFPGVTLYAVNAGEAPDLPAVDESDSSLAGRRDLEPQRRRRPRRSATPWHLSMRISAALAPMRLIGAPDSA